jgi:hypothetical protein
LAVAFQDNSFTGCGVRLLHSSVLDVRNGGMGGEPLHRRVHLRVMRNLQQQPP